MLIALAAAIAIAAAALIGLLIRARMKGKVDPGIAFISILIIAIAGFSMFFYPASLTLTQKEVAASGGNSVELAEEP